MSQIVEFDDWMDQLAMVWRDQFGFTMPNIDKEPVWKLYWQCDYSPDVALTRYLKVKEAKV